MSREDLQKKITDIENKISSVESEIAHLDLKIEHEKVKAVRLSDEAERERYYRELQVLKQDLAYAKADYDKLKRFKRQICLDNVDYLLAKQGKKLGELETNSGNRPGYLSRMKSGKSNSDPSIEFLMTAAEELDVPLELLISADLTKMSATEEFIVKFIKKLIEDTQKDELVWNRETLSELEKLEITNDRNGYRVVDHPLYEVEEGNIEENYYEEIVYNSLFYPRCGVEPAGNCYNAYLSGTNSHIYIMDCKKGDERITWSNDRFFEIYMVEVLNYGHDQVNKICSTLDMSSPINAIVNSLIKNIISSQNRVHIDTGVRSVIDAYLKGIDITGTDDDEMPFN